MPRGRKRRQLNGDSKSPTKESNTVEDCGEDNSKRDPDELPSIELYEHLNQAGINDRGASKQCRAADGLEDATRQLNSDERHLIGSLAEDWSLSLLTDPQGNGLGKDSIKWLSYMIEDQAHLDGDCQCKGKAGQRLPVLDGRVKTSGSIVDPVTLKLPNSGSRPNQEIRQVYKCCSPHRPDRVRLLLPKVLPCTSACTVLELDTESGESGQLKVSFKLQEKQIMRRLSTIQGQLYVLLLLVFKRLLPEAPGSIRSLRACHAKALLFFMISEHSNDQESAWTKEKLISLLKESLGLLVSYLTATKTHGDCMPNFFMPDATLRLKSTSKAARIDFKKEKHRIIERLRTLQKDVSPLLNFVKNHVSARESDRVFQLFTALPMVELNDFEAFTGDALLYLLVQHLFNQIPKLQVDARKKFLQHIEKLRSLPSSSSVSTCLAIMARLRLDDTESAKEKLQQVMWRHVEPCRFNFPCEVEPDFSFLPEFTRKLIKITPYGSGNMLQVNFRSLLMSLQAELLPKEQIFLNEWRRAVEPDPDIDELYALAHYSRNIEQIRKCSKKIWELLDCENRGLGDAQKHWSVARKACFNGLFMVTMLAAALAALSRVPILISDGPVLVGVAEILIFIVAAFACLQLFLHTKFVICLFYNTPSRYQSNQRLMLSIFAILPILSVAWSILLNQRFFLDISNIIGQRLLPDLMRFRQTADKIFLELVLALT
ncbi:hypothetical protein BOX15_Mlig002844g1 [Macrostomum lignano]|uniref:Mab-21-like HhH/H2TH-like domain-containing protein n=1 Tax=Macrostomum lignano TaxID=282301 RepID=A0A267DLJ4_9PLAT|nr:hypothetical protein BOX15_Mlig002844g1 [Macrostomum lignano]